MFNALFNTFLYPDSLTYMLVKLVILGMVLILWFTLTTAAVV